MCIYKKCHIYMYFLRKIIFHFPSKEKISYFPAKKYHFSSERKIIFQLNDFWKDHLFGAFEENISYFHVFFWERSSCISCKNKLIFSGKINTIFPDNTRKVKLQRNFFWKTIFSEHLEKENMVFGAVSQLSIFLSFFSFSF